MHEREAQDIDTARTLSRTRYFWWVNYLTDYTGFDFLFEPVELEINERIAWPSQWQKDSGTYLVPKQAHTKIVWKKNFMLKRLPDPNRWVIPDNFDRDSFDWSWHPYPEDPAYIHQFGTQWQKTGGPCYVVPNATVVKYVEEPRVRKINRDNFWIVPSGADVDSFDWSWHPDSTEAPYIYQFGTQHQRTGGPQYHVTGATEVKFMTQLKIKTEQGAHAIYEIDHLDGNAGKIKNSVKTIRYFDNYLDTLTRLAKNIPPNQQFVWICSSVCDYTDFDFSWHPELWQNTMLHVFASSGEKFGDTFYMHVPSFRTRISQVELLDWYDLNFVEVSVPRRPVPVVQHNYDTHVEAVKTIDWLGPLAVFSTDGAVEHVTPVPLWREQTKTIVPLSAGASQVIVPKSAVPAIKTQLYDYAYIDRTQRHLYADQLLDIVFIDNGESEADSNYQHLCQQLITNKVHRSSGINGRVAAYQAAARLSTTPWFFAVFAKLEVDSNFDWTWQPDRLQEPKHYIFHARNPVNGLEYGHQAVIAYNCQLVLTNLAPGLDFTLDQAHEVVPMLSGTAKYDTTPWMAWRTAFRECIKLRHSLPDVENEYRLNQWLTVDNSNGKWSQKGAEDAVEFYDAVDGDFAQLRNSYDWAWLAGYALTVRNLIPDHV